MAVGQTSIYQVDLREQKLVLDKPTFHIAEVLDLRTQHQTIGWVQRGMNNIRVPANLAGGVKDGLSGWLQVQLPPRPGSRAVLLRVHDLRIGEVTKVTSEKASALVDVDFVYQQPDGSYRVLQRYIEEEESRGVETTGRHDDNIVACLQRACTQLNALDWAARLALSPALTQEQVYYRGGRKPAPATYAILTAPTPAMGIYGTFLEFRNNKLEPVADLTVEATNIPGEVKAFQGRGDARKALDEVWGFSDGQQVYIRRKRHFYALKRSGDDFTFTEQALDDPGAVSTAGALGGLAGAAIAAVAVRGDLQEYTLDMTTGRVADFDYMEQLAKRDTATVVVYRRPGGPAKPLAVLLDGQELKQLPANDFVLIPWTSKTREISLCLDGADAPCYAFIPTFGATTYVELKARTDKEEPTLQYVPLKEGDYYVKKMRRR
ncbi:hypothetical protein [Hymenobacter cellulosilyticus]|uniref:Uncharacterized protein n=1 Tax=Hymenobacter cellulosilyticus TaxID=2932248 RepID=A0A8T9QDT8_9BACT|nr:hypothetical protein [Hymenobacter cellulosilyticus]UOQ74571.1 hypothetical protein MUN79_12270 [Hymenobacter cellulosilyticus]